MSNKRAPDKIILFSCTNCPGSRNARAYLEKHAILFVERNIDQDPEAAQELQDRGIVGTPFLIINGREFLGFDPDEVREVLEEVRPS